MVGGVSIGGRRLLLIGAALSGATVAPAVAGPPPPQPRHGRFVAGAGAISAAPGGLTINQTSARGIIDWRSFSIGPGRTVSFRNGNGATLNVVTGASPSRIAGALTATGSVYLVNPAGVVVAPGGQVIAHGGFAASTRPVDAAGFMATGVIAATGTATADVVNQGRIVAGGDVILLGHSVSNSGAITAASARLQAAGGNVYALAGNDGGVIHATGTATRDGRVMLVADGDVAVAGTIEADGAGGAGGTIEARGGGATTIAGTALLSASGQRGGAIRVGVSANGAHVSRSTTIADGARLLAAGATVGGRIETSGQTLALGAATVNAGPGGTWTVDPGSVTIGAAAASAISGSLNAGSNVAETASSGDIVVAAPISWNSRAALALSASGNIDINAAISIAGGGELALTFNRSSGALQFGGGNVAYAGAGGGLTINGDAYALVGDLATLAADISANPSGLYALRASIDAGGGYAHAPVATPFSGVFQGLGNTIGNLVVHSSDRAIGLFATLDAGGTIENVGLPSAAISGAAISGAASHAGALVGDQAGGLISNAYATGSVVVGRGGVAGMLVGDVAGGEITGAWASGWVVVGAGGSGGGLVGENAGAITDSYATTAVAADGGRRASVGGLVGADEGGDITESYATGSVSAAGRSARVGGLVGSVTDGGAISFAYAAGAVGGASDVGGLVGRLASGTIASSYWDVDRSGTTLGVGRGDASGATGLSGAAAFTASSYAGFAFTATPGGSGWALVDLDGSMNNAGGAGGGTLPMLASEYRTTIVNAHQLQLMEMAPAATYELGAHIVADATGSSASYATGDDVWGPGGFIPIGGDAAAAFTGSVQGSGHTISGLRIASTEGEVGLFGEIGEGGAVANLGLTAGSVSAAAGDVGALAGVNAGVVREAFSSDAVNGASGDVGGLVGLNTGAITLSYATGGVTGGGQLGGLVGTNAGSITNAYAAGSVALDSSGVAGGLVGTNAGAISDAYATGAVGGPGSVGGFVGSNDPVGVVTAGYWDTTLSGTATGVGVGSSAGATGLATPEWLTAGPVATGVFNTSGAWLAGYPHPVLRALGYVLISVEGSAVEGSAPVYQIISITDRTGASASGDVNVAAVSFSSAGVGVGQHLIAGAGAIADAGYQLAYDGTLTITPKPPAPPVADAGSAGGNASGTPGIAPAPIAATPPAVGASGPPPLVAAPAIEAAATPPRILLASLQNTVPVPPPLPSPLGQSLPDITVTPQPDGDSDNPGPPAPATPDPSMLAPATSEPESPAPSAPAPAPPAPAPAPPVPASAGPGPAASPPAETVPPSASAPPPSAAAPPPPPAPTAAQPAAPGDGAADTAANGDPAALAGAAATAAGVAAASGIISEGEAAAMFDGSMNQMMASGGSPSQAVAFGQMAMRQLASADVRGGPATSAQQLGDSLASGVGGVAGDAALASALAGGQPLAVALAQSRAAAQSQAQMLAAAAVAQSAADAAATSAGQGAAPADPATAAAFVAALAVGGDPAAALATAKLATQTQTAMLRAAAVPLSEADRQADALATGCDATQTNRPDCATRVSADMARALARGLSPEQAAAEAARAAAAEAAERAMAETGTADATAAALANGEAPAGRVLAARDGKAAFLADPAPAQLAAARVAIPADDPAPRLAAGQLDESLRIRLELTPGLRDALDRGGSLRDSLAAVDAWASARASQGEAAAVPADAIATALAAGRLRPDELVPLTAGADAARAIELFGQELHRGMSPDIALRRANLAILPGAAAAPADRSAP